MENFEELKGELLDIMGSTRYQQRLQQTWAELEFILNAPGELQARLMEVWMLFTNSDRLQRTDQFTHIPEMSLERFEELLERMEPSLERLEPIARERMSLEDAAKKVLKVVKSFTDIEESAMFMFLMRGTKMLPYEFERIGDDINFKKGEAESIIMEQSPIMEDFVYVFSGRKKFFQPVDEGLYVLEKILQIPDKKTQAVVMWLTLTMARELFGSSDMEIGLSRRDPIAAAIMSSLKAAIRVQGGHDVSPFPFPFDPGEEDGESDCANCNLLAECNLPAAVEYRKTHQTEQLPIQ